MPPNLTTGERMSNEKNYALGFLFGKGFPEMTAHTPQAKRLRMLVEETGPGFAVIRLPYHTEIVGDPSRGVIFGGAITTLIDQASGLCVACSLEDLVAIATIDLRVDYLRAAEPGRDLFARAECYKLTKNIAFVHAKAYEDSPENPFANCLGTFMLAANSSGSALARYATPRRPGEES